MVRARAAAGGIEAADLVGVSAALAAGASPGAALAEVADGPLASVARSVRLGRTLRAEAAEVATGDTAADLLVRALAVVEHAGTGAAGAVAQSLRAVRDGVRLEQLLRSRTAQARATARALALLPLGGWLLLLVIDPRTLGLYATPLGVMTGLAALLLGLGGRAWSRRLIARAAGAGAQADPLAPPRPRPDPRRAVLVGLPVVLAAGALLGVPAGLAVGTIAGLAARRPRPAGGPDLRAGGTAEAAELLAVALGAGLSIPAAVTTVAGLAPPAARPALAGAGRQLRGGGGVEAAFDRTPLSAVGRVLAAAERWGAPSADTLRELAQDLRRERHAAAEEAAERVQVSLVFPTTLLTLPSFVLAVIPPLLWTAFRGGAGLT